MGKRVLSEAQIQAARENGLKSRGPISIQGKAAVARNAIRHGILSRTIVLDGESADRFVEHLTALQEFFEPANEVERSLVEIMAVCHWRQMRIWGVEKAGLTSEIRRQSEENEETATEDPATRTFRALCQGSRPFELLGRYETRFDRQYNRALQRLNELRARRGITLVA